jgi:hypothetical protein
MVRRKEVDTTGVVYIDRETFFRDIWDYKPGEHVTVIGPTNNGKTQLLYGLLNITATREDPAVILVMKPKDETIDKFTAIANANRSIQGKFITVRNWPPPVVRTKLMGKPRGYVLWPKGTGTLEDIDDQQTRIFKRAIQDNYRKGHRITVADETYSLENEMGLSRDLNRVWTKGRSVQNGLWAGSQRPVWISRWAYQAHHLFLSNDPDELARKRYGEIGGGFDPELIRAVTTNLKNFQFLYIHRMERTICIVGA